MDGGQRTERTEPVPFDTSFVMITVTLPERNGTHTEGTQCTGIIENQLENRKFLRN